METRARAAESLDMKVLVQTRNLGSDGVGFKSLPLKVTTNGTGDMRAQNSEVVVPYWACTTCGANSRTRFRNRRRSRNSTMGDVREARWKVRVSMP